MEENYGIKQGLRNIRERGLVSALKTDWEETKEFEKKRLERVELITYITTGGIASLVLSPIIVPHGLIWM